MLKRFFQTVRPAEPAAPRGAQQARARLTLAVDAATTYRLLTDLDRLPEWMEGVVQVDVLANLDDGLEVAVHSQTPSETRVSRWAYAFDQDAMRVAWRSLEDEGEHGYPGAYVVAPCEHGCLVTYVLDVPASQSHADAVVRYLEQHAMPQTLEALRVRASTGA